MRSRRRRDVRQRRPGARSSACSTSASGSRATPDGELDLGREGAHTHNRVVHWQDVTGREIQRALLAAVERAREHHGARRPHRGRPAVDGEVRRRPGVLRRLRARPRARGEVKTILRARDGARDAAAPARSTSTRRTPTSRPATASRWRTGSAPRAATSSSSSSTRRCSTTRTRGNFLLSEAMRGEGGVLRLATGETFMENYHPMKSLASRDIVARAIDNELKKSGADSVFLDMTQLDAGVRARPVPEHLRALPRRSASTSRSSRSRSCPRRTTCAAASRPTTTGATTIAGLYAIGECAFTGLHGANRLASNSLLEGMVYSTRAAAAVRDAPRRAPRRRSRRGRPATRPTPTTRSS